MTGDSRLLRAEDTGCSQEHFLRTVLNNSKCL